MTLCVAIVGARERNARQGRSAHRCGSMRWSDENCPTGKGAETSSPPSPMSFLNRNSSLRAASIVAPSSPLTRPSSSAGFAQRRSAFPHHRHLRHRIVIPIVTRQNFVLLPQSIWGDEDDDVSTSSQRTTKTCFVLLYYPAASCCSPSLVFFLGSGRRRDCSRRPPTPPHVRFRIRRFMTRD
jgi:hypothetical protein